MKTKVKELGSLELKSIRGGAYYKRFYRGKLGEWRLQIFWKDED